jgi:N-acetylglucosaminyl-diphospho-decaprenol L-rhamnosyltransferase
MADSSTPRLSIVIVTYNSAAHIHGCLRSLVEHSPAVEHEILVVDNASTDTTVVAVRARWSGVRVIEAGRNLGFAAANNLGIRHSSAPLILLLNPDTVVPAGAIDTLIAIMDQRSEIGIAGPRLVDANGHAELSWGRMLSPWAELRQQLVTRWAESLTRREREVDWVSGACMLVRRQAADAAGLMDERYFMYAEDVDFCAAVRRGGWTVLFTPAAQVIHLRGQSRATASAATERAYRESQIAFYEKHHPRWAGWLRRYLKAKGSLPDKPLKQ